LLGSIGLGIVVLRNVLERRGELAVLRALGFSRAAVRRLVVAEHWLLLVLGLVCGVTASLVAIWPSLRTPGARVPVGAMAAIAGTVVVLGFVWIRLASAWALRGELLNALRKE
jgi:ABC-type antimicrobial peptide transport system permease subunit